MYQAVATTASRTKKIDLLKRLRERTRREARRSTAAFSRLYRKVTPGPQQVEMAARFDDSRLKYQLDLWPRDHGKTQIYCLDGPLREICNDPDIRILIVQKTATEAEKVVSVVKTELEENRELRRDYAPIWLAKVGERDIVNKAGLAEDKTGAWQKRRIYCKRKRRGKDPTLEAVGVGGAITGGHFDLILCDDILDDENTKTEERCETVINWFFGTVLQLREPHTKVIVVGTLKTLLKNLYSEIMENPIWNVTVRSALLSHDIDEIKFTPHIELVKDQEQITGVTVHTEGVRVMWPAKWPIEALILDMLSSPRRIWRREKCNDLKALLERIFKRLQFRYFSPTDQPHYRRIIQSWDTAFKETAGAAYSAMTEWGQAPQGAFLRDVYRDKLEWPELSLAIPLFYLCAPIRPDVVLIEDKASGQSAIQSWRQGRGRDIWLEELRRYIDTPGSKLALVRLAEEMLARPGLPPTIHVPVVGVKVGSDSDKEARAEDASVWYAAGQVWHPELAALEPARRASFTAFEDELIGFPGRFKDFVDSAGQGILYLLGGQTSHRSGVV
jgi:phage terminase large subunit-like protein